MIITYGCSNHASNPNHTLAPSPGLASPMWRREGVSALERGDASRRLVVYIHETKPSLDA